jgi:hypothetical protein
MSHMRTTMYITRLSQGVVKDVITPMCGLLGFLDFPHLLLDCLHFRLDGLHRFLDSLYLSLDYFDYFQFCVNFISTLMSLSVVEVSVLSSHSEESPFVRRPLGRVSICAKTTRRSVCRSTHSVWCPGRSVPNLSKLSVGTSPGGVAKMLTSPVPRK